MQQAAKLEAEKAERYREFTLGKYAYGKGQYQSSTQLFTVALDREGPFSPMGGEIQLWLALAYQVRPHLCSAKETPSGVRELSGHAPPISQCSKKLTGEWAIASATAKTKGGEFVTAENAALIASSLMAAILRSRPWYN